MSLSFDEKLTTMYSFSREEMEYPLVGVASTETLNKYFLGKETEHIKMRIYKIDVTHKQYIKVKSFVDNVFSDSEGYLYNFLEPLKFISNISINCYKTYVCSTFVFDALKEGNILSEEFNKNSISPQELGDVLSDYLFYDGLINQYKYFKHSSISIKRRKFKIIISPMKTTAFYTYVVYRHLKKSIYKNYITKIIKKSA